MPTVLNWPHSINCSTAIAYEEGESPETKALDFWPSYTVILCTQDAGISVTWTKYHRAVDSDMELSQTVVYSTWRDGHIPRPWLATDTMLLGHDPLARSLGYPKETGITGALPIEDNKHLLFSPSHIFKPGESLCFSLFKWNIFDKRQNSVVYLSKQTTCSHLKTAYLNYS